METTKKYIPFAYKKEMVQTIVTSCITQNDEGIYIADLCMQEYFTHKFIAEFLGTVFPEDKELEKYDELCSSGEMDKLIAQINDRDYWFLIESVEKQVEHDLKILNSIEGIISKLGLSLLEKIDKHLSPKGISKLAKAIEKFNPDTAKTILEIMKQPTAK